MHLDMRIGSLNQIIDGLQNSIAILESRMNMYAWYDGLFFAEDAEPIYGLAFIAMQNYIYSSIKDFFDLGGKNKYLKIEPNYKEFNKTRIELIVGLANYAKHRDDEKLHGPTKQILDCFYLNHENDIDKSPIFEGLTILNEKWDLTEILLIVGNWRAQLLIEYYKSTDNWN